MKIIKLSWVWSIDMIIETWLTRKYSCMNDDLEKEKFPQKNGLFRVMQFEKRVESKESFWRSRAG